MHTVTSTKVTQPHPWNGWHTLKQPETLTFIIVKFGPYHMDGCYGLNNGDRIALEFLGCSWHRHCCCFNPNDLHPLSKIPFGVLRRQSDNKMEVLRKTYNLKVRTIWEKAKQNDPDVRAFMSNYTAPE